MKKNTHTKNKKVRFSALSLVLLIFLSIYALSLLYSLYWGVVTSFKINDYVFRFDIFGLIPNYGKYEELSSLGTTAGKTASWWVGQADRDGGALLYTYRHIVDEYKIPITLKSGGTYSVRMPEMYLYSFLYAFGSAFANTLIPCITAYLCARYKFKFSKVVRNIVLITMVIPIIGSLPSEIMMANRLGIFDTIWGVWLMKANFLGLYFLVFYEVFKSLPMAFSEAAEIDGASNMQVLLHVGLPLIANTFLTVFLIKFVDYWNDYQTPLVFMPSYPTIAIGLNTLVGSSYTLSGTSLFNPSHTPSIMAAVVLTALPVTILFLVFQKKLLGNLTLGGVKG